MDNLAATLSQLAPIEWISGAMLLFFFAVQLLFWLFFYKRPYDYRKRKKEISAPNEALPPVSVIVTSKDNAEELARNLPFILEQDYPDFEVIVVNRRSADDTDMVLKAAEQQYPRLYHTYVPQETNSINEKKLAITLGVKAAKNDYLLFTEAYCKPCSKQWIKEYGKEFVQGKEVVLGFSRLALPSKGSFGRLALYGNLIHQLRFLSMAILHKPLMGTGRNLAYKKELFFRYKAYSSILNMERGGDDLYISQIAPKEKTGVVLSEESMTETGGEKYFSARHAMKSGYTCSKKHRKKFSARLPELETVSKYFFYIAFLCTIGAGAAASGSIPITFALMLFLLRHAMQWRVTALSSRLFNAGKSMTYLPFYDLLLPLIDSRPGRCATRRNRIGR